MKKSVKNTFISLYVGIFHRLLSPVIFVFQRRQKFSGSSYDLLNLDHFKINDAGPRHAPASLPPAPIDNPNKINDELGPAVKRADEVSETLGGHFFCL